VIFLNSLVNPMVAVVAPYAVYTTGSTTAAARVLGRVL